MSSAAKIMRKFLRRALQQTGDQAPAFTSEKRRLPPAREVQQRPKTTRVLPILKVWEFALRLQHLQCPFFRNQDISKMQLNEVSQPESDDLV
ncbi:hypothetical protein PoB_007350000 [Plakobranchus ocellatus]|uniref:Uncharacterized protein n=1 Tax=Plakobranchus ocellatus TaxID=259542 RepID=A0AAV4DSJ4_9GAST|nr:hypothetical protein PoB_007350000 [Plakobranchus ocellatus]